MYIFFLSIPVIIIPILLYIRIFTLSQKMQKSDISTVRVSDCKKIDDTEKSLYSILYNITTNEESFEQEIIEKSARNIGAEFKCFFIKDRLSQTGYLMLPVEKLPEYQSPKKNILLIFSSVILVLSLFFAINTVRPGFIDIAFKLLTPICSIVMFMILLHNVQVILDKRTMVLGPSTIALNAIIIGNQRRLNTTTGKFLYHPIYEYSYKEKVLNYVDKGGFATPQQKGKQVILYYSPVRKQIDVQQEIKENVIAAIVCGITGLFLIVAFLLLLFI